MQKANKANARKRNAKRSAVPSKPHRKPRGEAAIYAKGDKYPVRSGEIQGLHIRERLNLAMRKDKEMGTVLVLSGSQRFSGPLISPGAYGTMIIDLSPTYLAQAATNGIFLTNIQECFSRFRFKRFAFTTYTTNGSTTPGEVAMGYLPDSGVAGTNAYPSDATGFARVATTNYSICGPICSPMTLSLRTNDGLDSEWRYSCRLAAEGTISAVTAAESRLEDQGAVLVSSYNASGAYSMYLGGFFEYELELAIPSCNSATEVYTATKPRITSACYKHAFDCDEKHDDDDDAPVVSPGIRALPKRKPDVEMTEAPRRSISSFDFHPEMTLASRTVAFEDDIEMVDTPPSRDLPKLLQRMAR